MSTAPATPGPKKRKNAAIPSLPKPKKQKLPRNLDSIPARNQLPNVPSAGGISKTGQRMVKGPYKKREKKDKDGKKIPPGTASTAAGTGAGGRKGKSGKANTLNNQSGVAPGGDGPAGRLESGSGPGSSVNAMREINGEDNEGQTGTQPSEPGDASGGGEVGEAGADGKDDDDDEHEEEPEYTEYEWNQEANSRGRSKEELRALLDRFSEEQLQRYEVYRRSVLSKSTVKKLVGTILNQQVSPTMAFVVAGFCKVFVGEMVEKAREVMDEWGETGAIRPEHLREAQRRYKNEEHLRGKGVQTPFGYKKRMFCR
ncbi:transcription initiation factor TFIID subunit 11 [Mortierella sp. AD011]|nr:transcription initiation factor TFIID subunit 11 [Mortierella sp. AD010]KAF9397404.1 transcription initiation factor TFIID subunit 11 [Mortierella sp. AD011]